MTDFRAARSLSPEGAGNAKSAIEHAWDAYNSANRAINKPLQSAFPGLNALLRPWVNSTMFDLFGFWMAWRLAGGFEGMQQVLVMSRSTLYRRISQFRAAFGEHSDVYEFPGVTIDVETFVREMAARRDASGRSDA